ncbi:MAG: patatin-like phospholipase family protein [Candidatus Marinimicrobia bacterium]|nr:patatin-like phospholipase family protein [Candidatus Neomarinimicrobiota bacterium]
MEFSWIKNKFGIERKPIKIGLALSGGAALGLSHIGCLKAFEEADIKPAVISGTSAGAIIGGMYCSGMSIEEIEEIALSIDRMKTFNLFTPTIKRGALIKDDNILNFFREHLGDTKIEDLDIPFVAVSVDIESGETVYMNKGSLIGAIRASISIPGIFPPFISNNRLLVDGGLRSNLPLEVLNSYDLDRIVGVNVLKNSQLKMKSCYDTIDLQNLPTEENEHNILEKINKVVRGDKKNQFQFPPLMKSLFNSLQILLAESSQREIEIVQPDLVINIDVSDFQLWEFWEARKLINIGYKTTKEILQKSESIKILYR